MPLIILFLSIFLGVTTFGLVFYGVRENPLCWLPAVCFGFWAIVGFLQFLAMC